VCPDAKRSAIRGYKLHENAREQLVEQDEEPAPSIFFSNLLENGAYGWGGAVEQTSGTFQERMAKL